MRIMLALISLLLQPKMLHVYTNCLERCWKGCLHQKSQYWPSKKNWIATMNKAKLLHNWMKDKYLNSIKIEFKITWKRSSSNGGTKKIQLILLKSRRVFTFLLAQSFLSATYHFKASKESTNTHKSQNLTSHLPILK